MSVIFNYVFLALWAFDYGWIEGARRYLRSAHGHDEPHPAEPEGEPPKTSKAPHTETKAPG
jgi:hypothetical protein